MKVSWLNAPQKHRWKKPLYMFDPGLMKSNFPTVLTGWWLRGCSTGHVSAGLQVEEEGGLAEHDYLELELYVTHGLLKCVPIKIEIQ